MDFTNANEAQKAAIMHLYGPCLVLAGPGSGKTYTITNRILYLLEQGVPPDSILVITFMKEAALSMQNRFQQMTASKTYPVHFGTFHSIFYHILRESNTLKSSKLLGNSEKKALLLPILQKYDNCGIEDSGEASPENPGSLSEDAAKLLSAIGYYKNTMDFSAAGKKAPAKWQPYFEQVCDQYKTAVKKTGRLDFDDMLYECKVLLQENKELRTYWQNRFHHILIDEFQDINPVQYEAVKLLAPEPCNLFAVGDDDQAIYGFRGSRPECIRRFSEEFHAKQFLLAVNYRSRHEIVQASLAVIGENKDRFEKQLQAAAGPQRRENIPAKRNPEEPEAAAEGVRSPESPPVELLAFSERDEQYRHMIGSLSGWLREGESCAVLFRTNSYMQSFASRLKAADIPYEMKERTVSIYEHFIVLDIMAYLQIGYGQGKRAQLLRILNKPSRHMGREALGDGGVNFESMRAYYDRAQLPEAVKGKVKAEICHLARQFRSVGNFSLRPAISYILKAMGYEQYLKTLSGTDREKWQEWQEVLDWLKEDAASYGSLEEWQTFQQEYTKSLEQNQERASSGPKGPRGREQKKEAQPPGEKRPVQLLTVHGAKGLEFDRVWIPDCNEKVFPHGNLPDEKTVEEERRIFYVAMTRAKKHLELLYLTGTKERPRQPSRFLNPLFDISPSSHSSSSSSNSQLSRYSSKASDTFSYSSSSSM